MQEVLVRRLAVATSISGTGSSAITPAHSFGAGPASSTTWDAPDRTAGTGSGASGRPVVRPLALTRRGRFLLVGLPLVLGVAVLIFLGAFLTSEAQATAAPSQSTPTVEITIATGETLWDLAVQHAPDRDPRDVVSEMVELNNLHTSVIQAGQSISVPGRG